MKRNYHLRKHLIGKGIVVAIVIAIIAIAIMDVLPLIIPIKTEKNHDIVAQYHVSMDNNKPTIDIAGINFTRDTGYTAAGSITQESLRKLDSLGFSA
ncbi:MAG: hypothetical protein J1E77_02035, partial [Prevotella sp.]|nr:hypothetical protein [Prevotella sp.]